MVTPATVAAQERTTLDQIPAAVDPALRYVLYLHGRIIEDEGRRPTHPRWGVYEYDGVLDALSVDGTVVVSEQRTPGTDMSAYAQVVVEQVRRLVAAGVPPRNISVIGFSKGGGIAIRASALLRNAEVNFVFLAACGSEDFSEWDIEVWGRVLSVYEASDDVGRSCLELFAKPGSTGESFEVEIDTGLEHGAFYRPREEWLTPVLVWIRN